MDDRELAARLRDRLHARFDDAAPSVDLASSVAEAFATKPERVGWMRLRPRRIQLGWSVVAFAVLATIAIVAANVRVPTGPLGPGQHASPTPLATQVAGRTFVVVPREIDDATTAAEGVADGALAARISALYPVGSRFGSYSSEGRYIVYSLPADGPAGNEIRDVLLARGEVAFIPLPPADYGEGKLVAEPGKPLPKEEPVLFGWEGIDSAVRSTDQQGRPTLSVALKPDAATAFAEYTTNHVNEYFAVVVDGVVALVPVINAPITGGQIQLSGGGDEAMVFLRTTAILVGGRLPESWRDHDAVEPLPEDVAVDAVLALYPTAVVNGRDLDVAEHQGQWRAVWRITIGGDLPHSCPIVPVGATDCPEPGDGLVVTVEAASGRVISVEPTASGDVTR